MINNRKDNIMNKLFILEKLKKVTWHILGFVFWLYIILQLFIFNIDGFIVKEIGSELSFLLPYKFIIPIILIALSLLIGGSKNTAIMCSYIIFYPFIFFFKFLGLRLLKNWQIFIVALPLIHDVFSKFRVNFIAYTFAIISTILIFKSENKYLLLISVTYMGLFCIFNNYQRFKYSFGENVFSKMTVYVKKFNEQVADVIVKIQIEAEKNSNNQQENVKTEKANVYLPIYVMYSGAGIFTEKVKNKTMNSYDKYLMYIFIYTYSLTLILYALIYYGISKFDVNAFSGSAKGFWEYLLLSGTFITGSLVEANLKPAELYVKFVGVSESMYMYLFIGLLIFTIFTRTRDDYKNSIDKFGESLDQLLINLENKVIDTFNISLEQIEKMISQKSEMENKMVNYFRKQRGMTEIVEIIQSKDIKEDKEVN